MRRGEQVLSVLWQTHPSAGRGSTQVIFGEVDKGGGASVWAEVQLCIDEAWFGSLVLRSDNGCFAGAGARTHVRDAKNFLHCVSWPNCV